MNVGKSVYVSIGGGVIKLAMNERSIQSSPGAGVGGLYGLKDCSGGTGSGDEFSRTGSEVVCHFAEQDVPGCRRIVEVAGRRQCVSGLLI